MGITRDRYDRNYFDNIAYREIPDSQRNRNRLREILVHKKGGRLLEVGCGKGGFLKLARRHFDVEGIDISGYAVHHARRSYGAQVRKGNIEEVKLPADYYDVVVIYNVLEHLKKPERVINQIYHSLTERGVVIGSAPLNATPVGVVHTAITNVVDRTHCSTYPPQRWRSLFQKTGFQGVHFFGEIMSGRNFSIYVRNKFWKYLSLNLMFVCKKQEA